MKPTRLLGALLVFAAGLAAAQEQAFTNRATELREKGDATAKVLANIPENTAVKVLARGGGWTQVEAGGAKGWVKVFHLRFQASVTEGSSGTALGGLTSALGFGKPKSEQAKISTVGVRGLSEEELKNANPDVAALQKMKGQKVDKPEAERFARDGKLVAQKVAYEGGK